MSEPVGAERPLDGPEPVSLGARLRHPRTLLSVIVPVVLIALLVRALPGFQLDRLPVFLGEADKALLVAALLAYYVGFPLRGLRWTVILRGAGIRIGVVDSTEIVFLSWLVNCLVPAKLGDVYRAYLLRLNGYVSFRSGLPPAVQLVFVLGIVVVVGLSIGLVTLRNFGARLIARLPLPERAVEVYTRFEEGIFAIRPRTLPFLGALTGGIWATEGIRLFLVVAAFHFGGVHLGLSGAFFVALAGSLLTAVPFTPGGLGVVEAGVGALLTLVYGVPPTEAAAIVLVDRTISILSIIVLGAGLYVVSPLRRGRGLRGGPAATEPAGGATSAGSDEPSIGGS
jgi:uncharacterized membrane protein YbhN (UPF0104 family)